MNRHNLAMLPWASLASNTAAYVVAGCLGFSQISYASDPAWWAASGTVTANTSNDYAVANQGQLKQFTVKAVQELNAHLPGNGAGATLNGMVYTWQQDYVLNNYANDTSNPARPYKPSDFDVVTIGQLKYVANLVAEQLRRGGYRNPPTWLVVNPAVDNNLAVLGELKQVFNFDLTTNSDVNSDNVPDWWENFYFHTPYVTLTDPSPNGDGLSILQSYQQGINPIDYYNGIPTSLIIVSGNRQISSPGASAAPLLVRITDGSTNAPKVNAPITCQVTQGTLLIASSNTGSWGPTCMARTDSTGYATIYGQWPANTLGDPVSLIHVAAGSAASAVFTETAVKSPAAGLNHTLAIDQNGAVWAWGNNDVGQIGNGTYGYNGVNGYFSSAIQVPSLNSGVAAVAAGEIHSLALRGSDGSVWAWGYNNYGQLGNNSTTQSFTPAQVLAQTSSGGTTPLVGVVSIAAGSNHNLALKSDGTVWAWGYDALGQLGNGVATDGSAPNSLVAVQVLGAGGVGTVLNNVTAIAAGEYHSVALTNDGKVWIWGNNGSYTFGNGNQTSSSIPVQVKNPGGTDYLANIISIAAGPGGNHTMALRNDGAVFAWGANNYGQLGNNFQGTAYPVQVYDVSGSSTLSGIMAIAAGANHSLAVKNDGTVYAWGSNTSGQLGINSTDSYSHLPAVVDSITGSSSLGGVTSISAGGDHSVALVPYMGVPVFLGWGSNTYNETDGSAFVLASSYQFPTPVQIAVDPDNDGLPNWQEYIIGSDPLNPDTNHDGIADGTEYYEGYNPALNGTNPFTAALIRNAGVNALDYYSPTGGTPPPPNSGAPIITLTFPPGLVLH